MKSIFRKFLSLLSHFFIFINYITKGYLLRNINETFEPITKINLNNGLKVNLYNPSNLTNARIKGIFRDEPETIEWINSFKDENLVFLDIGANIGLFSIYASMIKKNIKVISIEPSFLTTKILYKNCLLNNLNEKIKIIPNPIGIKKEMVNMHYSSSLDAAAYNTINYSNSPLGKEINTLAFSINELYEENLIDIPAYIKIDVDGNELDILKNSSLLLEKKEIKSLMIEASNLDEIENYIKILSKYSFKLKNKFFKDNVDEKFKVYNCLFSR